MDTEADVRDYMTLNEEYMTREVECATSWCMDAYEEDTYKKEDYMIWNYFENQED